jgi:hypothetical protein
VAETRKTCPSGATEHPAANPPPPTRSRWSSRISRRHSPVETSQSTSSALSGGDFSPEGNRGPAEPIPARPSATGSRLAGPPSAWGWLLQAIGEDAGSTTTSVTVSIADAAAGWVRPGDRWVLVGAVSLVALAGTDAPFSSSGTVSTGLVQTLRGIGHVARGRQQLCVHRHRRIDGWAVAPLRAAR